MPIVYGDPISGNCQKVRWVAAHLGFAAEWRDVDLSKGETRTPEFLAMNPDGRVPILVLDDGRVLAESNAIISYLARGSALVPEEPFARAKMLQWLFWEQYSHEPYIAVRRFQLVYLRRAADSLDPRLFERGNAALALMDRHLSGAPFMVGDSPTLADVALVAYTRLAPEGGFELAAYPAVTGWIARVETALGIEDRAPRE